MSHNSPFKRFGIEHLSPSSLNLWVAEPGLWSLRYLFRVKDETAAAMARGIAVENAMLAILHGKKGALEIAYTNFEENMVGEISDEIDAEKELIKGMVGQCELWKPPSPIIASQLRVEHWFDGVSIPVIGFIDFLFEDGLIDLKTTKAIPSAPKADHCRQVALYSTVKERPASLLYVSAKKHACYTLGAEQTERSLFELQSAAVSLERFLSRFIDAEDCVRCLPINRDSFRFSKAFESKLEELHIH